MARVSLGMVKRSSSNERNAAGTSVIAEKLSTGLCQRYRATWVPRNGFSPCSTAKARSSVSASEGSRLRRFCFIGRAREKLSSHAKREARSFQQVYATTKFNPTRWLIGPTPSGADLYRPFFAFRDGHSHPSRRRAQSIPRRLQRQARWLGASHSKPRWNRLPRPEGSRGPRPGFLRTEVGLGRWHRARREGGAGDW